MPRHATFEDEMDGAGVSRRTVPEADLDITPMIDVTFLLLIFFMVSSTMQNEKDIDVPMAQHGTGVEVRSAGLINIYSSEPEPVIEIESVGMELTLEDVESEVAQWYADNNNIEVIIKAERDVPSGFVSQVVKSVTKTEGVKFSIGVQDPK